MDSDLDLEHIEELPYELPQPLKDISNQVYAEPRGQPIPVKVRFKKSHPCFNCDIHPKLLKRNALDKSEIEGSILFFVYRNMLQFAEQN